MPEDYTMYLTEEDVNRPFAGQVPKDVLIVFFYWDIQRESGLLNYIEASD